MPLLPWGSWTPDTADYESQTAVHTILNVVPRGDGYGPFPDFETLTQALPASCRGGFYALKSDGSVAIFAATSDRLYQLNNTDFSWTDVSLDGSAYGALSASAQWQFAQTGNFVFATQANALLQVFDLTSSTAFANALGSPPQAAYISVVGQFLVLSGLLSTPYRIVWSGLDDFNSSTSWTAGVNQSDFQDFPDGGIVRGVAGGEFGTIFQDQAIRSMSYVQGDVIFQIERITQDMGLYAPYSIVRAGSTIFFYAGQGFYKIDPGQVPVQIGRERVDRTFLADLDKSNLQLFMGAADPRNTRIYWAYKSVSGQTGLYDKIIGYDRVLDKWFPLSVSGEYLLGLSQSGITLENLDALAPTPLTITGAADNGSGAIRLTLSAESNSDFTILGQNNIVVYGVTGTTEANGTWQFTVIDDTHIDLTDSTFTNDYVSGGQIGGSLDALIVSLDSYPTAVQPQISQFGAAHKLGFFTGTNLEASFESAEQGTDGQRLTVKGFRPITDAPTLFGSISYRDTQLVSPIVGSEVAASQRTGRFDMMRDARYVRFRERIPAGTIWSFSAGIEPDTTTNGTQ
jgi:hypothetical protein